MCVHTRADTSRKNGTCTLLPTFFFFFTPRCVLAWLISPPRIGGPNVALETRLTLDLQRLLKVQCVTGGLQVGFFNPLAAVVASLRHTFAFPLQPS